ncbi:ferritin-like domain-containing protein [Rhodovastum sp. RN2-1]|uniref:Ferritin-like domain-containing protein n=2 Tax=Limobrevibacterium gyesilva TaxID=2991712 RepID=A0AA42CDE2_9PROT|nr:ferritin-like domain-containing protein [Limobrevibacterium gyesilva]MCW3473704.1 ferritin-like domain-containing protein [Limobrevibacterium gyesilva]
MDALTPPPCGLQLATPDSVSAAAVAAADRASRTWTADDVSGPVPLGSDLHRRTACRMFRETFNPYKPSIIDWPKLSPEARDRLVNLPIWDIAVQTEGKARLRMLSYARSLADPDWRDAIELNGWEEGRHKVVLSNLVQAYGITLEPEPAYVTPRDSEWAYLVTGFSECVDSFFAFGLFELAKRSAFFPPELVDTFEPVIQEECRHILLFANWLAWHRRRMAWWKRPWFELRVAAVWVFLGWERIGLARGMDEGGKKGSAQDNNFTVTGSKAVSDADISVPELMRICLAENDRRFAGYDRRLRRPTTMPALVRFALTFMRRRARG